MMIMTLFSLEVRRRVWIIGRDGDDLLYSCVNDQEEEEAKLRMELEEYLQLKVKVCLKPGIPTESLIHLQLLFRLASPPSTTPGPLPTLSLPRWQTSIQG